MKKKILACLASVGMLSAFAEDAQASGLTEWVGTAKTTMEGWATTLAPLFGVGITLVLLFLGWKLFKRTTNKAA